MSKLSQLQDVDLKLLRYFCTIVEEGSLTAAQSSLNLSQSSLSEYLKALEIRLGVVLCQRGPKGFRLFDEGREVYTAAREMFDSIETFRGKISSINDGAVGQLSIGIQDGIVTNPMSRIPEALEYFGQKYPGVRIKLEVMLGFKLIGRVADGLLPLGIGLTTDKYTQLTFHPIFEEPGHLYCGKTHPLFERQDAQLTEDLLRQERYCSRGHLEYIHPKFADGDSDVGDVGLGGEAQLTLILSGRSIGYLSESTAGPYVATGLLRIIDGSFSTRINKVAAISGPGTPKFKLAQQFIKTLSDFHRPAKK